MSHLSGHPSSNGASPTNGQSRLYDEALGGFSRASSTSLREWIGLLWGGKWIILGVTLLVVGLAAAYTYSLPSQYQTSTLLFLDRDQQSITSQLGQQMPFGASSSGNRLSSELFLLRNSNVIADRVAERLLDLGRHPQTGETLPILTNAEGDSLSVPYVSARVHGMVSAYAAGPEGVNAMRVAATSTKPAQAALAVNLYAEEYIAYAKERSRESQQASRRFLEKQAEQLRTDVESAEAEIEDYIQTHGAVSLDQESGRIVTKISELEARRDQLRIELDMKQAALDKQQEELSNVEPQLAERMSSSLNTQLQNVQQQKAELEMRIARVEERNPGINGGGTRARELRQMRQRVDRLSQKADSLAQAYVDEALAAGGAAASSSGDGGGTGGVGYVVEQRQRAAQLRIDISGLEAQLDVVNQRLDEYESTLQRIPEQSMELAQLQRERRSAEQIFGFVREKLQEIRLAEESEVGFAEVIQSAGIPRTPIGPDSTKNLVLALLFGLGLGTGIVVLWTKMDTRIHEPDDLKQKGYSVAGVIPSMQEFIDNQFGGADTVEIDGMDVDTELVMLTSPMSAPAEAYRRLRTTLRFARPDDALQTVVITSPDKGEGKTTTSTNLALALASAGKETLLIDADLRNPRLHDLFGRSREPGLSHLLFDETTDTSDLATGIDHLSLLTAGASVPNPAELLGSQRMRSLLQDLQERYDVLLIDTPPVLLFSDGLALASHCDGTLLVAAADTTDGRAVDHAADQLGDVDAALLGCVLNRYTSGSSLYGYGYNYGYAQSYQRLTEYYQMDDNGASSGRGLRSWMKRS